MRTRRPVQRRNGAGRDCWGFIGRPAGSICTSAGNVSYEEGMAQALQTPARQPQQAATLQAAALADLRAMEDRLDWQENQAPGQDGWRTGVVMWVLATFCSAAAAATSMAAWHTMHRGG